MPSFGLGEILLIFVIIVLFIRPEDLPRFIRNFGRVYGDVQRFFVRMKAFSKETLSELAQADSLEADKRISGSHGLDSTKNKSLTSCEKDSEDPKPVKDEDQLLQPRSESFEDESWENCEVNSKIVRDPESQNNLPDE